MSYSDSERAEAMIRLAFNKYNFKKTSVDLDIPEKTLRRWDKSVPKKGISELLERTISRLLMAMPEKWSGNSWAVAMGILLDKWLLIHGEPTSRVENIFTALSQMTDDELTDLQAEFQAAANRRLADPNGEAAPEQE